MGASLRSGAGARPRAAVLDEVWRTLDGVDALSAPHGGPLSRTTKLLLDPLVIRPVIHPECAGPLLNPGGASTLTGLLKQAQPRLAATAGWFIQLKHARRAARITDGSPQDLYFQRCFELAAARGGPSSLPPDAAAAIAAETVQELHADVAGRTVAALREYVAEPGQHTRLARELAAAWAERPTPAGTPVDYESLVHLVLQQAPTGERAADPFPALVSLTAGWVSGARLWDESTSTAKELGLTAEQVPQQPGVGESASTATLAFPLDRTVFERVFTVLQSPQRSALAPVAELVAAEITRSCAPWALLDESLRVTALVGAQLAMGLRPMANGDSAPDSAAAAVISSRWGREAYVLRARRLALGADAQLLPGGNPLLAIAAELRTPWRAYSRRLWVRLHGRDVRAVPVTGLDELWDVLDGVARSVILDHRERVKRALTSGHAALEPPRSIV